MASLDDIFAAMQNGVTAISELASQINTTFSSVTVSTTTSSAVGTLTFNSSVARAFLTVTTSTGGTYYLALY